MDCSTPGFLVLHYLPEFAQIHVHWAGDAIQLPHPPALNLSQHQSRVFSSEKCLLPVPTAHSITIFQSIFFSFWAFYFVLGYSWLTMLIVSGEQWRDSAIHTHVSIPPQITSHPGCHITLSRVPCAEQQVLVGYPFKIQQCRHVHPKLPNYPSPPATISSLSKSHSIS